MCWHLPFAELQNEVAKLKHRIQVAEEERDIAVQKERETKELVNTEAAT